MTNKDTQIFQFNQSQRNTPYIYQETIWDHAKMMVMMSIDDLVEYYKGDFEVIIRRKNE